MRRYLATVLLAAVSAWVAFEAWTLLDPRQQINAVTDPGCDLRAGPCTTVLDDRRSVRFSVEPKSIPPLTPLLLRVDTLGFAAKTVTVDLNGVGMQMGYNRVSLRKGSEGHFEGTGLLSVCIRDVMEWEALVSIQSDDVQISAPFRFITVKDGIRP